MVRKKGKLPGATIPYTYDLEYGTDTIEIQADAIAAGPAGGGARRSPGHRRHAWRPPIDLVPQGAAATSRPAACIIELSFLDGRKRLDVPFTSVVSYEFLKPSARACQQARLPLPPPPPPPHRISVASALICGLTPRRTLEKITIGKVVEAGPGGEAGDDEIVERQREGQQPARRQRRRDQRQGDDGEHLERPRAEIERRLLERAVEGLRAAPRR